MDPSSPLRETLLSPQELAGKLQNSENSVRLSVLGELFNLEIDLEPYVNLIATCIRDPDVSVRLLVVALLGHAGAPATEPLVDALDASQPVDVRIASTIAIAGIGEQASYAVGPLCQCLYSEDVSERKHAALALSKIGQPAVEQLLALLDDLQQLSSEALQAFAWMGATANAAEEKLRRLAPKLAGEAQVVCYGALLSIKDESSEYLAALNNLLTTGDQAIRKAVIEQLSYLSSISINGIALLLQALQDSDPAVRAKAALALGRTQADTEDLVEPLIDLLHDAVGEVQISAALALGIRGPSACPALPELKSFTQSRNERLASVSAAAIRAITPVDVIQDFSHEPYTEF